MFGEEQQIPPVEQRTWRPASVDRQRTDQGADLRGSAACPTPQTAQRAPFRLVCYQHIFLCSISTDMSSARWRSSIPPCQYGSPTQDAGNNLHSPTPTASRQARQRQSVKRKLATYFENIEHPYHRTQNDHVAELPCEQCKLRWMRHTFRVGTSETREAKQGFDHASEAVTGRHFHAHAGKEKTWHDLLECCL